MTNNELKFFDPETGKPLHRVPDGATIPKGMPYGFIRRDGNLGWISIGPYYDIKQGDDVARFTREPIAPPTPPLPTEPGSLIRAVNNRGDKCAAMIRDDDGDWVGVDQDGDYRFWVDGSITSWEPMTAIPTETWERLRVFDPEVKLDRADSEGRVWRYSKDFDCWESESGVSYYRLAVVDANFGPLRFADEVSDR